MRMGSYKGRRIPTGLRGADRWGGRGVAGTLAAWTCMSTTASGDTAHCGAGGHLTKRRDIGDTFGAVFFDAVLDDFIATRILDIDIDIRHRDTIRVQKPLKQ